MISFAAQGIHRDIDISFPVLMHLKPGLSFIKYDMFFATFENNAAMTAYDVLTFPHHKIDDQFRVLDLPPFITISPDTFSFFLRENTQKY